MSHAVATTAEPRVVLLLRLVRFSHTLFAMPYAVAGFLLAARGGPADASPWATLGKVVLAMVFARTAAMAFNRLVDRRVDATNPRTAERPSVTGALSPRFMSGVVVVCAGAFVAASFWLNDLCGRLSFIALAVVLGYSYTKRFTALSHFVLGAGLGLSPLGAYLAVRGVFDAPSLGAALMGVAVLFWTAGFDVLYACQDVEHDRREGLRSLPERLGVARALRVARGCHAAVPPLLWASAAALDSGVAYWVGTIVVAALLVWEHRLVRADDLSQVNKAFFHVNVAVSVIVAASVALDLWIRGAAE